MRSFLTGAIPSRPTIDSETPASRIRRRAPDRVSRTRSKLELALVEYVAWFNNERLHTSLGGVPPAEHEQQHARR
ncbi:MAG: IS3 family transposase [Gaiellaceae bacterium]